MENIETPQNQREEILKLWREKISNVVEGPMKDFQGVAPTQGKLPSYNLSREMDPEDMHISFTPIPEVEVLFQEIGTINDKKLAIDLVHEDREWFTHLNQEMRNDKEIALYSVSNEPRNFLRLSEELQNDEEICLALAGEPTYLANNKWDSIYAVPDKFKNDREFVLKFVRRNPPQIMGVEQHTPFGEDEEIKLAAIQSAVEIGVRDVLVATISFAGMSKNKEVILKIINNNPEKKMQILDCLHSLRDDEDILKAVNASGSESHDQEKLFLDKATYFDKLQSFPISRESRFGGDLYKILFAFAEADPKTYDVINEELNIIFSDRTKTTEYLKFLVDNMNYQNMSEAEKKFHESFKACVHRFLDAEEQTLYSPAGIP